jgi:hypothetical protein
MKKVILLVVIFALGMTTKVVKADFTFGKPVDLGLGSGGAISVSADGLELYFTSDRSGGLGYEDIWVSTRQSTDEPWSPPVNLTAVNSTYREAYPSISPDGLTLYFSDYFYGPDRPGGLGGHDLWMSTRASRNDPWSTPVNMGAPFNSLNQDVSPTISRDGLTFIFASDRGGSGNYDLLMCTRSSVEQAWEPPVNLSATINSGSHDYYGNLSPDGLVIFFESNRSGDYKSWMSRRRSLSDPWDAPVPVPEPMYSMGVGCVSSDSLSFYAGMSRIPIVPIIDLNGDFFVDAADMCIIVDHWNTDNSMCDVGPAPWGDGIVNVEDLVILAGHLFEEVFPPELIAYWRLDEAEGDIAYNSASENHGLLSGNPMWRPTEGKAGGALQFDGVNDYIGTEFVLNPWYERFSVFAWVKGGAPGQVIICQTDGLGTGGTWLGMTVSDGNLISGLVPPKVGRSVVFPLESQYLIADDQWHHIGFVWDGMYRALYADGTEVAKDTQALTLAPLQYADGGMYIGAGKNLEAGTFFSGLIDDVRIYNKALSAEEVAALGR